MSEVFAELNERGDRCVLTFPYNEHTKNIIKGLPGARFVGREKGGPHWTLPLDLTAMRALREKFGNQLLLGDALKAWGHREVQNERKLRRLAHADDCQPEAMKLYHKLPKLLLGDKSINWPGLRPYQRADIAFLARQTGVLNLNEQRLGKTPEIIGSIFEADMEDRPILIVGMQKSLDSVWRYEFERFTNLPVYTYHGQVNGTDRAKALAAIERHLNNGDPFVLGTTADMIRRGLPDELELVINWGTMVIDEFHKTGLPEPKNVFSKKAVKIKAERKYVTSGTPIGGKPIKFWGALHFVQPDRFTSKWRWAGDWLEISNVYGGHKQIGGIKPGKEDAFYDALMPFAVRRLREEVLPQLPPIQTVDVWCSMSEQQRKQYEVFHRDAEIRIDEHHLSATSVLAEYTRLKQFANARNEVEVLSHDKETGELKIKIVPTFDSGKLPELLERLIEQGIDPDDPSGTSQAIVASQFAESAMMISRWLTDRGIKNALFTGKTKDAESKRIQRAFKAGNDSEGLRVCSMVTTMGVGITLDNVETVHLYDETWNPDDQTQVIDRAVNTTRNHQITAFRYRSRGTIEEYIYEVTSDKTEINKDVLDRVRQRAKRNGGR